MSQEKRDNKPQFTIQMIEKLAGLCRIKLADEQKDKLLDDLKKIVTYVEQLNEVDTEDNVECTYVASSITEAPLREDEAQNTLDKSAFLHAAPEHIGGMVRIPTVLKQQ